MKNCAIVVLPVVAFLALGCAGRGSTNAVAPSPDSTQSVDSPQSVAAGGPASDRYLWGLWIISVSADHQSMDLVPWRVPAMHLNVVKFLEVAPCTDCLKIQNVEFEPPDLLTADLVLRHPLPDKPRFCGFDVRGVFITPGDFTFPINDRLMAWGDGLPRLLNSDGYTSIFNPTEYPSSSPLPPDLKYFPGKYSTGGDLTATLNPYIAYPDDPYSRRPFWPSAYDYSEYVELRVPDGPFEFGYAVDASWMKVEGEVDEVDDFPIEANCPEAYCILVDQWNTLRPLPGSSTLISVEICDHQDLDTIKSASLEAPDLFDGQVSLEFVDTLQHGPSGEVSYLYSATISNSKQAPEGLYPMLVTVTDTEEDANLGIVKAYQVFQVRVTNGWLDIWGAPKFLMNWVTNSAIDADGQVYVCGIDAGDKDPSPEELEQEGAYISKFDDEGKLIWARSWDTSLCQSVALDSSGNVYATGQFEGKVDFDPGPGEDFHQSNGGWDIFITKFDSTGNHQWTLTWGCEYGSGSNPGDCGMDIAVDQDGNIFTAGTFEGLADFDPGPEVFELQPLGESAGFLSKFNSSGDFLWALSWGGESKDSWSDGAYAIQVYPPDNIYVFGHYSTLTDFDPGPGVDERVGSPYDCFVVKFNDAEYQWVRTWESSAIARLGRPIEVDNYGDIYLTGSAGYYDDIDPTEGEFVPHQGGYVTKLSPDGALLWITLFDAQFGTCFPVSVTSDQSGAVTVSGAYNGSVDFDPTDGIDLHSTDKDFSMEDFKGAAFVCQITREGAFRWANSMGDNDECWFARCTGLVSNSDGAVYAAGTYETSLPGADFDPGPLTEYRSTEYDGCQFLMMFPPDGVW